MGPRTIHAADIIKHCAAQGFQYSAAARPARYYLNEDQYTQCWIAVGKEILQMMKTAGTQPFSLLGLGTVGIRAFNLGITIPTFVLGDNYAHRYSLVQLLSVAAGRQNNLQRCRQVAHISVDSVAKSVGIENEQVWADSSRKPSFLEIVP